MRPAIIRQATDKEHTQANFPSNQVDNRLGQSAGKEKLSKTVPNWKNRCCFTHILPYMPTIRLTGNMFAPTAS
jgi:hypothetical protein